jgi:NitT/TauT family transport system permease protein
VKPTNPVSLMLGRALMLVIILSSWEVAALLSRRVDFAIARPTTISVEMVGLLRGWEIWSHVLATGGAALSGLILGTLLGTLLGLLTWFSRSVAQVLRPFILALGAMPILAVAPLMIIWFGIGIQMKIALACLSTIFVAFAQSSRGAENVSSSYVEVLRGMNASGWHIFRQVVVPGSLDWVFSAMRLNAGLALLGAFIGEFIASNVGLGYLVLRAASLYNVPRAIAASLFIVGLALAFEGLAGWVEKHRNKVITLVCLPRNSLKPQTRVV